MLMHNEHRPQPSTAGILLLYRYRHHPNMIALELHRSRRLLIAFRTNDGHWRAYLIHPETDAKLFAGTFTSVEIKKLGTMIGK